MNPTFADSSLEAIFCDSPGTPEVLSTQTKSGLRAGFEEISKSANWSTSLEVGKQEKIRSIFEMSWTKGFGPSRTFVLNSEWWRWDLEAVRFQTVVGKCLLK